MAKRYAAAIAANTDVALGPIETNADGTYLLNVTNRTDTPIPVRVAVLTTAGTPGAADWINYDLPVPANGNLARWPLPLGAGWVVYVRAPSAGLSAQLLGREKA